MWTKSLLFKLLVTCMQIRQTTTFELCNYHPAHDCPDVIALGSSITCRCKAEVYNPGCSGGPVRQFSIAWEETNSPTLHIADVQQRDQSRVFHCVFEEPNPPNGITGLVSGQLVLTVIYTVQVAQPYGPSSVQASGPTTEDKDGETPITFQCSAADSLPPATYTWSRVVSEGSTYTFIPTPDDDGAVLQCEATNPMTGTTQVDHVVVNLQYPPTSPPTITSSATSQQLHEGDSVTLTCKVSGGKPHVSSVAFSCPDKIDNHDVFMADGVSSNVTFDRLTLADNGKPCICTARWQNSDVYALQAFTSVTVLAAVPAG